MKETPPIDTKRPPYFITDIKMFQDVVALFSQVMNAEHKISLIADYLFHEAEELVEAVEKHEPYGIASEAADVIVFTTEIFNILDIPLEQAFAKVSPNQPLHNLAQMQQAIYHFMQQNRMHSIKSLADFIVSQSRVIVHVARNGNNAQQLATPGADIFIASTQLLTQLGFSAEDILSRKMNRNHHKYNLFVVKHLLAAGIPPAQIRVLLKNKWDPRRDDEFLKGQTNGHNGFNGKV